MTIPNNITKNHILLAIQEIDLKGLRDPLYKSRKFDLIFNGKDYPPKYTIAVANQFANNAFLKLREFNPTQAHNYLKNISQDFVIQPKGNDLVSNLIEKYKTHIRANGLNGEIYKWKLLAQFKGRPDVTKSDFTEELTGINFANLVYPVSIAVIHHIALERAEPYRECFKVLLNEEKSLLERVKYFNEETLKIYRELVPEEKFSHHQDERTIAAFLTYHDPAKYSFYKDSYYQKACKLLEIKAKPKGEKYVHFMELLEEFIVDYISEDKELLELINPLIDSPDCFQDKNHLLLAQDILYQTLDHQIGLDRAYWRIGTTDGDSTGATSYWDEMKTGKNVCIGWPELGNLNDIEISSKNDIESLFTKTGTYVGDKKNLSRKSGEVFDFYNNVKIGDVVLSQIGTAVLGIGIIADEYYHDAKSNFPHHKQAEWKIVNPVLTNKEGLRTTVFKLKDMSMIKQIDDLLKPSSNSDISEKNNNTMKSSLNQILFGPPGTGKTYNTINKAIAIANPVFDLNQPRKDVKQEFERLMKEGQVVFTTFHQSMGYEDFIEGIKPLKPDEKDGFVKYDVIPGIFKKLCRKAETPPNLSFDIAYQKLLVDLEAKGEIELKTVKGSFKILTSKDGIDLSVKSDSYISNITKEGLAYVSKSQRYAGTWGQYYKAIFQYIKDNYGYKASENKEVRNHVLIIDEINRGNVSQIFGELITLIEEDKRLGKDEAMEVTLPYSKESFGVPSNVYIIGTMNTADRSVEALDTALRRRFCFEEISPKPELLASSRIFWNFLWKYEIVGWDDKKYINAEKKLFDLLVPSTKIREERNTNWGAIEKEEQSESQILLFPDHEFSGISLEKVLRVINQRIEKLLDKDHQIGHSYFMSVESLDDLIAAFYNQIIPLLQEYFFGDYGKIGLVLGQGFVQKKVWNKDSDCFAEFEYESSSEFDDRPVYEIIDHRNNDQSEDSFAKAINSLMNKKIG